MKKRPPVISKFKVSMVAAALPLCIATEIELFQLCLLLFNYFFW